MSETQMAKLVPEHEKSYVDVTEVAGDDVSEEQIQRALQRYGWAAKYCKGKDVLELACGAGFGLGILVDVAATLAAGDIDKCLVERAKATYGNAFPISVLDATRLPFPDNYFDVVILFEAIYYIEEPDLFLSETRRVLRHGGHLLIATANKDLFDFAPSPYSVAYYNAVELGRLVRSHGFQPSYFVGFPIARASFLQRALRPVKKLVVAFNLMPKTMAGKKLLKRLVFGRLRPMPADLRIVSLPTEEPEPWPEAPNTSHKVLYMAGRLIKNG
ncbi:MAG: hypothetical protein KatS3mg082_2425 [Nitrospiraceae bacterium]|nr:MAG: hypothetical protein KatS3mg082_2425 [Nitrospiraceae bacterium]